jgi:hypothetical protein
MKLFSKLDTDYFNTIAGRELSKKELKILYTLVEPILKTRERISSDLIEQKKSYSPNVKYEIRNIDADGKWTQVSHLIRRCSLAGFWPKRLSYVWLFKPTKSRLKKINEFEKKYTENIGIKIDHHAPSDVKRKISGAVIVIAISAKHKSKRSLLSGQKLGYIKIPRPGKTLINESKLKDVLSNNNGYVDGISMEGECGLDLRKILARIPEPLSINVAFPEKYKKGDGLIIYDSSKKLELERSLSFIGYELKQVGILRAEQSHVLSFGDSQEKLWPKNIAYISIHNHQNTFLSDKNDPIEKVSKNISSFLNIVKEMIKMGYPRINKTFLEGDEKRSIIHILGSQSIGNNADPFLEGIRSVADLIRKMALVGSNVEEIRIITNSIDQKFLDGQQTAIRILNLKNKTFTDIQDKFFTINEHQVIGVGSLAKTYDLKPSSDSDFIIMLGALKGELKNSLYGDISGKHNFKQGTMNFDSTLEVNINNTLIQSISTGVIKHAVTIGKGGLAVSLLEMYLILKGRFGIKVHISNQLNNEELLFGESLVSSLVLIGEKELMEFQRICILHSVPCSTIGRLHTDRNITVNKMLNITHETLALLPTP